MSTSVWFKSIANKTQFEFANQCPDYGCHLSFTDLTTGKPVNMQINYRNFCKLLDSLQRVKEFFETDSSVVCKDCGGRIKLEYELQAGRCQSCIK